MVERTTPIKKKRNYNPWKITSFSLIALLLIVGMFFVFSGVSKNKAGSLANSYFIYEFSIPSELIEVKSYSKDLYEIFLKIEGKVYPFYLTKDGDYFINGEIYPIRNFKEENIPSSTKPSLSIYECAQDKEFNYDMVFYYSDSCGWCSRMKPGVEVLKDKGYKIYSAGAESKESSKIVDECIAGHMTSNGVPQFICVRTGEIKVGAFVDSEGNLNQSSLDNWAENCFLNSN